MWLLLTISSKLFKLTLWNDKVSCVQNILSGPVYEIKSFIKFSLLHVIIINFNYRWRCCFLTRSFLVLNVNRSRKNTLISTKWHILCLPRRGWTSNRSRRFHTGNIPIETYCFPVELGKKSNMYGTWQRNICLQQHLVKLMVATATATLIIIIKW